MPNDNDNDVVELGYTVNEEHFWIYFRSIERSRPSTQTDLAEPRERKERDSERNTGSRFASRDISRSFSLGYARTMTATTTKTTRGNQSVILLRGLFRAAISFPHKWPDPIRFHGVPRRARVRKSLSSFSLMAGRLVCNRNSSLRDSTDKIIL